MITDICTTFGCGSVLTLYEKMCGNKCSNCHAENQIVGKLVKSEAAVKQIGILVEHFENDANELRWALPSGSSIINTQRRKLIRRYDEAIGQLNKLISDAF